MTDSSPSQLSTTPSDDEIEVCIVTFKGVSYSEESQDSGNDPKQIPIFDSDSSRDSIGNLRKKYSNLPKGLVAILYGSFVDVTDLYPFNWDSVPKPFQQDPPAPDSWRLNRSGVERLEYSILHILAQQEHPGVFTRYLVSGEPLDNNIWMSRRAKKIRRVDFTYQGSDFNFVPVPAIQVALQGLMETAIDPGYLVHAMYQANRVQIDLIKEALQERITSKAIKHNDASTIIEQEERFHAELGRDLDRFKSEPVTIYIVDRAFSP